MGVLAVNMVSVGVATFGILGGTACALGWGALKVSAGELEVRSLIVILIMGAEIFRPIRELMILYHQGINAMAAAEGIFDLLETPVTVREGPGRQPLAVRLRRQWCPVARIEDRWSFDLWWLPEPLTRTYYRVNPGDGRQLTVFHNHRDNGWYRQSA